MVYGADRIVQMPVMQLYDTGLMQSAINNARYMYEKPEKRMDDFYEKYDNFITPIQRDQDWYNENVIGKFRKGIDELYARGEDPLRTASGRAKLAQLARSIDVGTVNKLRTSADNAREFLKERSRLEAAGLYNPLLAKYDGPDINSYSTLKSGAWDKMSPTKIVDMATFGNPYYEGMKPNVHKASKNGISYSIESITPEDLEKIANDHYNELVSTAQGQLMYKYYKDMYGSDDLARDAFNKAVAAGQTRRVYQKDDYDDNWLSRQKLNLERAKLGLDREQFNWKKTMDLYALGVNQDGTPRARGAADQLAETQQEQYNEYTSNIKKQYDASKQKVTSSYGKLSNGYKIIADKYKKAMDTLSNKNAKKEDTIKAANFVSKWKDNQNKEFKEWKSAYEATQSGEAYNYYKNLTSGGQFGQTQDQFVTMKNARDIFKKAHIVGSVTSKQKADLNTALNTVTVDGQKKGTVSKDTEFSPITEARFTGGRMYKYNSIISKINRLIKGKQFDVDDADQSSMEYGSASKNNVLYDIIQHRGKFTDSSITDFLKSIEESNPEILSAMDIKKISDGEYSIPISTRFSRGNQTWANVNIETHKRIKDVMEDAAIEQGKSVINKYGN